MSGLWSPDKNARELMSSGDRKERIGRLKHGKAISKTKCPECSGTVYYKHDSGTFLTLSGSTHECVGLKSEKSVYREVMYEQVQKRNKESSS